MKLKQPILRLLFLAPVLFIVSCSPGPERYYFHDDAGRIVLYHGVNVSNHSKYSPDFLPWQTKEDFARLRDWGFNVVRYLVFWDAIEPNEGTYDDAYIDATLERLAWLRELGIYVLVDIHQDLFSLQFGGDGFPQWAVNDCGFAFHPQQPWNLNYLEPAVIACYTNFWNNHALQEKYAAMMRHLLEKIDPLPNVIGIDIMNEPFPGLILNFESTVLSSFYDRLIAMRNEAGFRTPLFFEPMILNSAGVPTSLDLDTMANCAFAPHYYDPFVHEGAAYDDRAKWWMDAVMKMRANDMQRFKTPTLFGEFGIDKQVTGATQFLADFLDQADRYFFSWTYYTYDKSSVDGFGIIDDAGNENPQMSRLVRAYPQRIAGTNPKMTYAPKAFHLTFKAMDTAAPTVIFVPSRLTAARVAFNGEPVALASGQQVVELQNTGPAGTAQTVNVDWQ